MWFSVLALIAMMAAWVPDVVRCAGASGPQADLVSYLPRVNFGYKSKQYAGYLNAQDSNSYFYWYLESQNNPTSDPLLVWFSSYPGCSALIGLLNEIGPFRPNKEGTGAFENVFAWNKVANVLVIDSPAGVGWSYTTNTKPTMPSDDTVATYNFNALKDFISTKFTQYNTATAKLYLAGEAYSGVFVLTLAKKILDNVQTKAFPDILKGVAIGNGLISSQTQTDSMMHYFYQHGLVGTDDWDNLLKQCSCYGSSAENCGFYSALQSNPSGDCAKAVNKLISQVSSNSSVDPTNILHDCYTSGGSQPKKSQLNEEYYDAEEYLDSPGYFPPSSFKKIDKASEGKSAPWAATDPAHNIDYDSTDSILGYSCWGDESKFLSQADVMKALHVSSTFNKKDFISCASGFQYNQSKTYYEMDTTITTLLGKNVHLLFYSGDLDMEYNFLGQEWYLDRKLSLKWKVVENRNQWTYRGQTAGYSKRWTNVDEVIVKGAGRYVAMDRGGPALQLIYNFLNNKTYSTVTNLNVSPKASAAPPKVAMLSFTLFWAEMFMILSTVVLSRL